MANIQIKYKHVNSTIILEKYKDVNSTIILETELYTHRLKETN